MSTEFIRGYCSLCSCWCPTIAQVREGVLVEVKSDTEHPLACGICPKGSASPELVYNKQRLQYPLRRTRPKGDPDPGWQRISWDEALDIIATKLNEVKAKFGAEAVAIARSGPGGSPMGEIGVWVNRLANAFGTPNSITTTHICQWHRDCGSAYTFGNIGSRDAIGRPQFEQAACILIWGNDTHTTRHSLLPLIKRGVARGAKLVVIDPRQTRMANMADLWLQVYPGTDGALALSLLHVLLEENLYDHSFVRDWTNAPLLVRSDTGNLLQAKELAISPGAPGYVIVDARGEPKTLVPGIPLATTPVLDTTGTLRLANGERVQYKTVFRRLRELTAQYPPGKAETITGVPQAKIRDAARMLATIKPACWYSWNGIEQAINATQTNRTACILYALTGNYDTPGGNVVLPRVPANPIEGRELLRPEADKKRLGFPQRPLGPGGITFRSTQAYEVYHAILTGKPYPVKALFGFGGNLITSNAPSITAREALVKLDFHAQSELFLTPAAELADIVLPVASSLESWHVGVNIAPSADRAYFQLRPAVVPPQHESRPDMEIIFELAKRLGLGDRFWNGEVEAGFNYQLAPAKITVAQLRMEAGPVAVNLPLTYQKYRQKGSDGNLIGFATPTKRVEIYSSVFQEHGYEPLPVWKEPTLFRFQPTLGKYPLTLIGGKVIEYCHSQHRALPSLRKAVPHPYLEINPKKARELGIRDGERVRLETPHGSITLQAKLTESMPYDVVCTQNGWWQACPELDLPGYDPYSPEGANVSTLYATEEIDPISGSLPLKGYPCNVRKA